MFYFGVDLAQTQDFTAVTFIEEPVWISDRLPLAHYNVHMPLDVEPSGWVLPSVLSPLSALNALAMNQQLGRPAHPPLYVRDLWRFERGTKYPDIVQAIKRLLLATPIRPLMRRTRLIVDRTGVGAPVVDDFCKADVSPIAASIHGGANVHSDSDAGYWHFRVPKRDLVAVVKTLFQAERLRISPRLLLAETLTQELLNFRFDIDPITAHDSYSHWRENEHDDLVLSTALPCWYREYACRGIEGQLQAKYDRYLAGEAV